MENESMKLMKKSALLKKEDGGNSVSNMLPFLLTLVFAVTVCLIMFDYHKCINIKNNINTKMQEYVDASLEDGCITTEVMEEIKDYLSDEYGVREETVTFTGTTLTAQSNGCDVVFSMQCKLPYVSNFVGGTYQCNFKTVGSSKLYY